MRLGRSRWHKPAKGQQMARQWSCLCCVSLWRIPDGISHSHGQAVWQEQASRELLACSSLQGRLPGRRRFCAFFFPSIVFVSRFLTEWLDKHSCVSALWLGQEEFALWVVLAHLSSPAGCAWVLPVPCCSLPFLLQLLRGGKLEYLVLSLLKTYKRDYSSKASVLMGGELCQVLWA